MKKVVVLSGGTGGYAILRGLKAYPLDITAVVTMSDSGGSSGILRDEFGILPPGDVRSCLTALAEENEENIVRELFTFRFDKQSSLRGHAFGNLFLTALTQITGSEIEAIKKAAQLLHIKGAVLPVTTDQTHLCAELADGKLIFGETNIDIRKKDKCTGIKRVF
ncbi:MAG: YvcK family protein, partial [Candidatus Woesearchaeota archaeon]|nr:YvcK family protein [Candidatus Woesearchaeota archaeon]